MVSVIVPVRNRSTQLRRCLAALKAQSYPANETEILVVDNDSSENIKAVCEGFTGITYLQQREGASYAARNAGILQARGTVLAFTDSDCLPEPDWLSHGIADLQSLNFDILGGKIEYYPTTNGKLNIYELYEDRKMKLANQEWFVRLGNVATANLITHKKIFDLVGLFDPDVRSGGDFEWAHRAVNRGFKLGYSSRATVNHARRNSHRSLTLLVKRQSGGNIRMKLKMEGWKSALHEIAAELPLSPRQNRLIQQCPETYSIPERVKFAAVVNYCSLIGTLERVKVSLGGTVYRGD